jgi:hypothetical protein
LWRLFGQMSSLRAPVETDRQGKRQSGWQTIQPSRRQRRGSPLR